MLAKAKSTMEISSTFQYGNVIITEVTYLNNGFDL